MRFPMLLLARREVEPRAIVHIFFQKGAALLPDAFHEKKKSNRLFNIDSGTDHAFLPKMNYLDGGISGALEEQQQIDVDLLIESR